MRIRNRKVPLPLSLLSPVPLSDPHLFSRSPVILVQPDSTLHNTPSSSNHLPTSDPRSGHNTTTTTTTGFPVVDQGVQINNNDDISYATLPPPLPPRSATEYNDNNEVVGRWCDDDKAIPLKKRRGIGFVENPSTTIIDDEEKNTTTTTATTTTTMLKWNNTNTEEKQGNDDVVAVAAAAAAVVGKKGNAKRGNTIMEGSRCSRVNGRGWRCCQLTLVGYSLCEHHLGKGRLRSMTSSGSAKSRSSKKKNSNTNNGTKFALGRVEETQERDEMVDNMNEKKLERMSSFGNSKRVKLGVVKARSLSSLLGQTNSMNMNNGFVADHANLQQHEDISSLDYQ